MKKVSWFFMVLLFSTSFGANACKWVSGRAPGSIILKFNDVTVLPTTPVGSVIAKVGGSAAGIAAAVNHSSTSSQFVECSDGDIATWNSSSYETVQYNGETLIDTGIQGIAIRPATGNGSGNTAALGSGVRFPPAYSARLTSAAITAFNYYQRRFELVKTGDVISGGTIPGGVLVANSIAGETVLTWELTQSNVLVGGCEVSDYPAEVSLGTAYIQQFTRVGDVGDETKFNITLTCNTGSLYPALTFSGASDSTTNTVFSNSDGDINAKNIGLQLLFNDDIITLDKAISLGKSSSSFKKYEFSARLYRLGGMTAGDVDIPVTFTLTYE